MPRHASADLKEAQKLGASGIGDVEQVQAPEVVTVDADVLQAGGEDVTAADGDDLHVLHGRAGMVGGGRDLLRGRGVGDVDDVHASAGARPRPLADEREVLVRPHVAVCADPCRVELQRADQGEVAGPGGLGCGRRPLAKQRLRVGETAGTVQERVVLVIVGGSSVTPRCGCAPAVAPTNSSNTVSSAVDATVKRVTLCPPSISPSPPVPPGRPQTSAEPLRAVCQASGA